MVANCVLQFGISKSTCWLVLSDTDLCRVVRLQFRLQTQFPVHAAFAAKVGVANPLAEHRNIAASLRLPIPSPSGDQKRRSAL